jgi:hypothetical protein
MPHHFIADSRPLAGRLRRAVIEGVAIVAAMAGLFGSAPAVAWLGSAPLPAAAAAPSAYETLIDLRPVTFTMTVDWVKVPVTSSIEELASNPMFWRSMHFDDWDRLPSEVRDRALPRMMERYSAVVADPGWWPLLGAADWDMVPQPVRAVLFPRMIEHWADVYGLTRIRGVNPGLMVTTLNAVMMAESWFEHRGINVNEWGNRDLGLGGCSDRCRRVLGEMAEAGHLDFSLAEEDYFNPWHSTRALVVWFGLELARANCNLDLAVRAYHRGFETAVDGEGVEYLTTVKRLRRRYFGDESPSPTLQTLRGWSSRAIPDTTH